MGQIDFFEWFKHAGLQIEVSQIIIHKADQSDIVVYFFDAYRLTDKGLAAIDFPFAQTNGFATDDHDRFVVKGVASEGSQPKTARMTK